MIFVGRYRQLEGATIEPSTDWFADADQARDTANAEGAAHEVDQGVYAADSVKQALEALFDYKCAYCEWKPTAGSDWDVEHYRPKAAVAERPDHPGYYWLAYDWENLYLSCKHCNQKRKDRPHYGEDGSAGPAQGKMDQFPLADETQRVMDHTGDIAQEEPLLLDPNVDDPAEYLRYDVRGQIHAIDDDERAAASIRVFHLERSRLRRPRGEVVTLVTEFLRTINDARQAGQNAIADSVQALLQRSHLDDGCQFAGVARAVVADPDAFGV